MTSFWVWDSWQRLGSELGRGGFGTVYAALDMRTGQVAAVKRIPLSNVSEEDFHEIEVRAGIARSAPLLHEHLSHLCSPCVVLRFATFVFSFVGIFLLVCTVAPRSEK